MLLDTSQILSRAAPILDIIMYCCVHLIVKVEPECWYRAPVFAYISYSISVLHDAMPTSTTHAIPAIIMQDLSKLCSVSCNGTHY